MARPWRARSEVARRRKQPAQPGATRRGAGGEARPRHSAGCRDRHLSVPGRQEDQQSSVCADRECAVQCMSRLDAAPLTQLRMGGESPCRRWHRQWDRTASRSVESRAADRFNTKSRHVHRRPRPLARLAGGLVRDLDCPSRKTQSPRLRGDRPTTLPVISTFQGEQQRCVLRDGQTRQFTAAADRITGEVVKVDVTLKVAK